MNKRGLVKFIFVSLVFIISLYFIIMSNNSALLLILINLLFALTTFMFSNKNKIKRFKFIYDVILLLLMIFAVAFFAFLIYSFIVCYFDASLSMEYETIVSLIYPMFIFIMLLFSFKDIFNKTNKTNDILTIVVSLIIILIYILYYLEPNLFHKLMDGDSYGECYNYLIRNYTYFILMYFIVLIHRRVNRI